MSRNNASQKSKISREFAVQLNRFRPQQKVRAVVMLHTKDAGETPARRQSRADRQAAVEAMRKSAEQALVEVDDILKRFDGKRLASSPDALGSIPIETTVAGITALTSFEYVKAILEDQPTSFRGAPN